MSKRTGRYGDPPSPGESGQPSFGERKSGAPLPLLTQPMIAVESREVRDDRPQADADRRPGADASSSTPRR